MSRFNTNPLVPHLIQGGHGYVYNADIGLRKWRATLARIKAGENLIANVNFLGDSLTEGGIADVSNPNNYQTKGYVGLIRTRLATLFGDVGVGFVPVYYPHENAGNMWVLNTGWALNISMNIGITKMCAKGVSGTGTMTFSFTGTGVKIFTVNYSSGGKFTWKIDTGVTTEVDTYAVDGVVGVTTVSGLSAASHTLTITRIADGKDVYVLGAEPTNATTKGVRVNNMARWGTASVDALGDNTFVTEPEINYWQPVLTCIAYIANDVLNATSITTYISQIQQLISIAKIYGDVMLINNAGTPIISSTNLKPYADAMKSLAVSNDIVYVDIASRLGDPTTLDALGLIAADDTHWTAAGHQDAATALLNTLLEER